MSEDWAQRQRDTNRLVGVIADHVLNRRTVTAEQLQGLCRLTWITSGFDDENAAYITSTKLPALAAVFGDAISTDSLEDAAEGVARVLGSPRVAPWVTTHTGFTHFYRAYRNTADTWLEKHRSKVLAMVRSARQLTSDEEGARLIRRIEALPSIPMARHPNRKMAPAFLLTPLFFSLDPRMRFPLINGSGGVRRVLSKMKVHNATLEEQYRAMVGLLGTSGIRDAADLDQVGMRLDAFVGRDGQDPEMTLLTTKATRGAILPVKDEGDIQVLVEASSREYRQLHNQMTNQLKACLSGHLLTEGKRKEALFDVQVNRFDGKRDLLIEVKSSIEEAHVRMAIGQLYAYACHLGREKTCPMAVLLPRAPGQRVRALLDWLAIGCLWFEGDRLETCTPWLRKLCNDVGCH